MKSIPRSAFGSQYLARWRASALADSLGEEHPATQAAIGRYHALSGAAVPQRGSCSPAAVAWLRQSGSIPGFANRSERRRSTP